MNQSQNMGIGDIKHKVLVTGGGGFIGSRLVHALLARGIRVKVLDAKAGRLEGVVHPGLEFVGIGSDELRGGMADRRVVERAVEDVDVIYHLAVNWDALTWKRTHPLADLFDANIRGTLNLLEVAGSKGVRHFLFASSIAVYGKESPRLDEETVCQPELGGWDPGPAYGILKLATEKLCLMYYHHRALPVTAFRIDVVFDDEDVLFLGKEMVDKVRKGGFVEVREGEGFSNIHVDEVVQAFLMATLNEATHGQVFNLSNPATYISSHELYQHLIRLTGSKNEVKLMKDSTIVISKPAVDKIQRTLGWKPRKTRENLQKSIAQTIRSMPDQ